MEKGQIMDYLFHDMNHKMHEIIQEAKKIMRHSKRDYLTCQDVKLAMRKLNLSEVFGYPSYAPPYEFQKMSIAMQ